MPDPPEGPDASRAAGSPRPGTLREALGDLRRHGVFDRHVRNLFYVLYRVVTRRHGRRLPEKIARLAVGVGADPWTSLLALGTWIDRREPQFSEAVRTTLQWASVVDPGQAGHANRLLRRTVRELTARDWGRGRVKQPRNAEYVFSCYQVVYDELPNLRQQSRSGVDWARLLRPLYGALSPSGEPSPRVLTLCRDWARGGRGTWDWARGARKQNTRSSVATEITAEIVHLSPRTVKDWKGRSRAGHRRYRPEDIEAIRAFLFGRAGGPDPRSTPKSGHRSTPQNRP